MLQSKYRNRKTKNDLRNTKILLKMGRDFRYKFCDANLKKISPEVIFDDNFLGPLVELKKQLRPDRVIENESPEHVDYFYTLETLIEKIKILGANYDAFSLLSVSQFNPYDYEDEILVDLHQISVLVSAAIRHNRMYEPNDSDNIIKYITFKFCQ